MKGKIFTGIIFAGTLIASPVTGVRASEPLSMGTRGGGPGFHFESRPDFIYLDDYGFSVSWGGPYDVVYAGDAYFIYRDGYWYRSYDYRGPWGRIRDIDLPPMIRGRRWNDIERRREMEYRRHDRGFWDNRFRQDRNRWREMDNRRGPGRPPASGYERRDGR
jgi:hypothetical protein